MADESKWGKLVNGDSSGAISKSMRVQSCPEWFNFVLPGTRGRTPFVFLNIYPALRQIEERQEAFLHLLS